MPPDPPSRRNSGLAAFAAATFVVSVIAVAALDRAGAPERLVQALSPILALIALGVFGIGGRTATLALFIAAGRRATQPYAALAVAAVAVGLFLALGNPFSAPGDPIGAGALFGVGLGMAGVGALVRRFGGASVSDVIATRFPTLPIRAASAIVLVAATTLVAFAGYHMAVAVAQTLVTTSRPWAETLVGATLVVSVASGGLESLILCSAATGAGVVLIALAGFALSSQTAFSLAAGPGGAAFVLPDLSTPDALAPFAAAAIGAACLFGAAPPTAGCRDAPRAAASGLVGMILFAAIAALAFAGAPGIVGGRGLGAASPLAGSLAGAATLAAALALAGLGVQGAARAFGVALARPPRPFATLPSVRLARMRAGQAAFVLASAALNQTGFFDSPTALVFAMALALAIPAPLAALAAIRRAGPLAGAAGALAAFGMVAGGLIANGPPRAPAELLGLALAAAAAAFVVGSIVAIAAPRRGSAPSPGPFDPFLLA